MLTQLLTMPTTHKFPSLGVFAEGAATAGRAQALVDVDAAGLAGAGRLEALVAHAPRLAVQQGALRVGRAENVGTRT